MFVTGQKKVVSNPINNALLPDLENTYKLTLHAALNDWQYLIENYDYVGQIEVGNQTFTTRTLALGRKNTCTFSISKVRLLSERFREIGDFGDFKVIMLCKIHY